MRTHGCQRAGSPRTQLAWTIDAHRRSGSVLHRDGGAAGTALRTGAGYRVGAASGDRQRAARGRAAVPTPTVGVSS